VVVSTHTIEHLQDDHGLIKAMKALSRPGGKIIIATPWIEEIQGHFEHVRGYTDEDMEALMKLNFQNYSWKKNNRDYVAVGIVE
jgi:2-polyprenyl-3-methyl-5-hydroxy-6-metoxy-1,4-benzoquinol methylase